VSRFDPVPCSVSSFGGYNGPAGTYLRKLLATVPSTSSASLAHVNYQGIRIHYKKHLDGGGSGIGFGAFGQDYIPFLRSLDMPKQSRVFEWCSGPGFIGFSMLAHGLCGTLCLADINDEAVEACQKTIRDNRLEARVAVYESDNLTNIPREEQWDLVVGNPPFYRTNMSRRYEHTTKTGTYIVSSLRRWASS
jgi:hypothetical protein